MHKQEGRVHSTKCRGRPGQAVEAERNLCILMPKRKATMQRLLRLEKLRHKVSYASGRRKIAALAELVRTLAPYDSNEAQTLAEETVQHARDLLNKSDADGVKKREYKLLMAQALAAFAESRKLTGIPTDEPAELLEAVQLFEECNAPEELCRALEELGQHHRQFGRLHEAMQAIERALHIADLLKQNSIRLRLLCARATIDIRQGNANDARQFQDEAHNLLTDCKGDAELAYAHMALAEPYYMARNYNVAVTHYRVAQQHAAAIDDRRTQAVVCWQMGFSHLFLGELDDQIEVLLAGLEQAQLGGFAWVEAGYCVELGSRSLYYGDFNNLTEFLQRAESIYLQLGDMHSLAVVYGDLGITCLEFNEIERGHEALRNSVRILFELEPLPKNIVTLTNMLTAECWTEDDYHRLHDYLVRALEFKHKFTRTGYHAQTCISISIVCKQLRLHKEAIEAAQTALEVARKLDLRYLIVNALHMKSELLHDEGRHIEALELMNEAEQICTRFKLEGHLITHYELLMEIHKSMGEYKSALDCADEIKQITEARHSRRNNDIVARKINQREFERLRRERDTAQSELDQSREAHKTLEQQLQSANAKLERLQLLIPGMASRLRGMHSLPASELLNNVKSISIEIDDVMATVDSENSSVDIEQVEHDFLHSLSERYPALSETERKVCALIKRGTVSKDICRVMNVSPRTVETYRYRIRRKLDLESGSDLGKFLREL